MRLERFCFGSIRIDDVTYRQDVVIDRGKIRKRRKKPSKPFRDTFGHTPLSIEEKIPWKCRRLVVGTGAHGALPVMDEVGQQATYRGVELLILPTADAIEVLRTEPKTPTRSCTSPADSGPSGPVSSGNASLNSTIMRGTRPGHRTTVAE